MTEPTASPTKEAIKKAILDDAFAWYLRAGHYKEALKAFTDSDNADASPIGSIQMHLEAIERSAHRIMTHGKDL